MVLFDTIFLAIGCFFCIWMGLDVTLISGCVGDCIRGVHSCNASDETALPKKAASK